MYDDFFYQVLGITGFVWIAAGLLYAGADYAYNTLMCALIGGIGRLRSLHLGALPAGGQPLQIRWVILRSSFRDVWNEFWIGAAERHTAFRSDKLSWSWPLTVLFLPTALYGLSRFIVTGAQETLIQAGISLAAHRLPVFFLANDRLQYLIWVAALAFSLDTFYRYARQRKDRTFFSDSTIFNLSRALLFDLFVAYMVMNVVLVWLDFSTAVFSLLRDSQLSYPILHPDMMYGLAAVHKAVLFQAVALLLLSFLPTVMLLREQQQVYSWIYRALFSTSLIIAVLLIASLIWQFDQRLEEIQAGQLAEVQAQLYLDKYAVATGISASDAAEIAANLSYYQVVMTLPGSFPTPGWFDSLFSIRILLLLFELPRLFFPKGKISDLIEQGLKALLKMLD
jgi:hypothetical protein